MNQHLQDILKVLLQSELSADEKADVAKSIREAEEELQSKNRDLTIEISLERVRVKAMAMQKSDDLASSVAIIFEELDKLNPGMIRCGIGILNKEKRSADLWTTSLSEQGAAIHASGDESMDIHPLLQGAYDAWLQQKDFSYLLQGKDLNHYYKALTKSNFKLPESESLASEKQKLQQFYYITTFQTGGLFAFRDSLFPEEAKTVMKRFAGVINLTYTRFLDLQKAEAQAREARVEAALERVRSKAMAMQRSEDLATAVAIVFEELDKLELSTLRCGISIINKEKKSTNIWSTAKSGKNTIVDVSGDESMDIHPLLQGAFNAWMNQEDFSYLLQGEDLDRFYTALAATNFRLPARSDEINRAIRQQYLYVAHFPVGGLYAFKETPFSEEAKNIVRRFGEVFNLTYTRFNDLKQAEAQTHKAKIETALEKVRARALAMQQPEELIEVAQVLRNEMGTLGVEELETATIFIHDENADTSECWFYMKDERHPERKVVADHITLQLNETWVGREMLRFYNSTDTFISIPMVANKRTEWIQYCYRLSPILDGFYGDNISDLTYHLSKFSNGAIGAASPGDISEESRDLVNRAASVFSLAYSRFRDLTKARFDLQLLKEEKQRSDSLLLNILPEEIAGELKQFGKSYARKHDQVTILFADIKGFSTIAEHLSADELVTQLDECFRAFDHIVDKHGLEKIKTVGDAYVCACGLPKPVADNAVKAVRAAIDMMDFTKGFGVTKAIQNLPVFEFRVGIHTGPVVTGVVGLKKFTYDIWGDAVNMAARMEQHGEAGKINISGSTYQLVKDKFKCIHRGKIPAKNKGEVDMYFVERMN